MTDLMIMLSHSSNSGVNAFILQLLNWQQETQNTLSEGLRYLGQV